MAGRTPAPPLAGPRGAGVYSATVGEGFSRLPRPELLFPQRIFEAFRSAFVAANQVAQFARREMAVL